MKLDRETFDPETEIIVHTDFAANYTMKQHDTETCARPHTCSQLVALLCRKDPMKCKRHLPDVWRIWSNSQLARLDTCSASGEEIQP